MKHIRIGNSLIKTIAVTTLGCFIASIGINMFLVNAKLINGGVSGIALIIQYMTGLKSGYTVFLINIPLFVISYFRLSRRFTYLSAMGMIAQSISLVITENFSRFLVIDDPLLCCIYGGVLCGIGFGLVFTSSASTGGIDIIVMLIRKYRPVEIGKLSFIINLVIISIGGILLGLPKALYTLLSVYIQGFVVDTVIKGIERRQLLLIVTDQENSIKDYIMNNLRRGVTVLPAEGGYTAQKKKLLYCIVSTRQMVELKQAILSLDSKAFISIMDVSEVRGKGFKNI